MAKSHRFQHLLTSIGVLRHPCDLDLLVFFHRHPQSLLTTDRLAAYAGYDLNQIASSLDLLADTGLLKRSQTTSRTASMYVLQTSATGWLTSLIDVASTPDGRRSLLDAMREASAIETSDDPSNPSDALPGGRRGTKAS
jgi:hypothetical protein